jgi:hypothetical protein
MGVKDKIRAFNGVCNFLSRFDTGTPRNKSYRAYDEHINNILMGYCKEFNIEYAPNNKPKYKGSNNPVLYNSLVVQSNFKRFADWVKCNYEAKELKQEI